MRINPNLLSSHDQEVLVGNGSVSNEQMEQQVRAIYEQFDRRRKLVAVADADAEDARLMLESGEDVLKELETIKR